MVFRLALETRATSAVICSMTLVSAIVAQFLFVKEISPFLEGVENFTGLPPVVTSTKNARRGFRFTAVLPLSLCIPVPFPLSRVPTVNGRVLILVSFEPLLQIFDQFFRAPLFPVIVNSNKVGLTCGNFFNVVITKPLNMSSSPRVGKAS